MFNERKLWERAQAGEYDQLIVRDGHPAAPLADEPFCTCSQIIAAIIAVVHQYLRQDGTLGAGGLPDPKRLLAEGVLHVL